MQTLVRSEVAQLFSAKKKMIEHKCKPEKLATQTLTYLAANSGVFTRYYSWVRHGISSLQCKPMHFYSKGSPIVFNSAYFQVCIGLKPWLHQGKCLFRLVANIPIVKAGFLKEKKTHMSHLPCEQPLQYILLWGLKPWWIVSWHPHSITV